MSPGIVRGSVVLVRFDPAIGSEVRKTRRAVVVSNHVACRLDAVLQVVPVTHPPDRDLRPYESRIDAPASGLSKPSRLVANQIRTIARARIDQVLGQLDDGEQGELDRALRIQLRLGS